MKIIEGTVDEIVEYEKRMGHEAPQVTEDADNESAGVAVATKVDESDDAEARYIVEQHVYSRAKTAATKERVLSYLEQAAALGTIAEIGESQKTHDGLTNYVMVRDDGPQRFGAVAYVRPANGGLHLRLQPEDVEDVTDGELVSLRGVREGHQYAVSCPLVNDDAVQMAIELTKRALKKVRV